MIQLANELQAFSRRSDVTISVGVDQGGTSLEGLEDLWRVLDGHGEVYVFQHPPSPGDRASRTFHPKVFLFRNADWARMWVGSGNLTQGGLYNNYEAGIGASLDLKQAEHAHLLGQIEAALDEWSDDALPQCQLLDPTLLGRMHLPGQLPREAELRRESRTARGSRRSGGGRQRRGVFAAPAAPPEPPPTPEPLPPLPAAPVSPNLPPPSPPSSPPIPPRGRGGMARATRRPSGIHSVFYIIVNPRQKTEIHLCKAALTDDPGFFNYPFTGRTAPRQRGGATHPEADPRPIVDIEVYDDSGSLIASERSHALKVWEYPPKSEFRIHPPERLRSVVQDGSILVMTRDPADGLDYTLEFYPPGAPQYGALAAMCTIPVPGRGGRSYGWA